MGAVGEPSLALDYAQLFGLDPSVAEVDAAEAASQQRQREQAYLQLALPPSAVLFVDTEERLLAAAAALEEAGAMDVIGLDCEWAPNNVAGHSAPVSVLQVWQTLIAGPDHMPVSASLHTSIVQSCCQVHAAMLPVCSNVALPREETCKGHRNPLHCVHALVCACGWWREGVAEGVILCLADSVQEPCPGD